MARSDLKVQIDNILVEAGLGVISAENTTDRILKVVNKRLKTKRVNNTKTVARDAITGKFVPAEIAEKRPNTTIVQKVLNKFKFK